MRATQVSIVVVLAGCLSKPRFDGRSDGGPDSGVPASGVSAAQEGNLVVVRTPDYTMQFEADSWKMPEKLVFNAAPNVDLLGRMHPYREDMLGVTLYDQNASYCLYIYLLVSRAKKPPSPC